MATPTMSRTGDGAGAGPKGMAMLITTTNDVPGYKVTSVLGEVMGLTVRSRNLGSQFGAAFKSLAGASSRA